MLNAVIATACKDLRLMAKDPGALAILFVMPLVFLVVMSLATTKLYEPSAKAIVVAIADEDRGAFATELVRELKATGGFDVVTEWQGKPLDRASAERLIVERRQQVVVVIPAGLSEALRTIVTGRATSAPGLYFCGQITSPTGQLREIGLEARRIAEISKGYIATLGH